MNLLTLGLVFFLKRKENKVIVNVRWIMRLGIIIDTYNTSVLGASIFLC